MKYKNTDFIWRTECRWLLSDNFTGSGMRRSHVGKVSDFFVRLFEKFNFIWLKNLFYQFRFLNEYRFHLCFYISILIIYKKVIDDFVRRYNISESAILQWCNDDLELGFKNAIIIAIGNQNNEWKYEVFISFKSFMYF